MMCAVHVDGPVEKDRLLVWIVRDIISMTAVTSAKFENIPCVAFRYD